MKYIPRIYKTYRKIISKMADTSCPPALYGETDTRLYIDDETTRLKGLTAYDVIELEEVDALAHLKKSLWNIIVIDGPNRYAFERQQLYDMILKRGVYIRTIDSIVYETPFNHAISKDALEILMSSEYSIYEVQFMETIKSGPIVERDMSLYNLGCSTVAQWEEGFIHKIFTAPCVPLFGPSPFMMRVATAPIETIDTASMLAFVEEMNRTVAEGYESTEALLTALFQDFADAGGDASIPVGAQ
jgi:hypothetical protein